VADNAGGTVQDQIPDEASDARLSSRSVGSAMQDDGRVPSATSEGDGKSLYEHRGSDRLRNPADPRGIGGGRTLSVTNQSTDNGAFFIGESSHNSTRRITDPLADQMYDMRKQGQQNAKTAETAKQRAERILAQQQDKALANM